MPILTPINHDPFNGSNPFGLDVTSVKYEVPPDTIYSDEQTREEYNRRQFQDIEDERRLNQIPVVTPPEMESDANFPDRVIDPNTIADRAMGVGGPPSYGAGRYKLYTPSHPNAGKQPIAPDAPLVTIPADEMKDFKKLLENDPFAAEQ